MKLQTRQFGPIRYEPRDVILMTGIQEDPLCESPWLLLADKTHPHLYWLQTVVDDGPAFPVCSLAGADWSGGWTLAKADRPSSWNSQTSLIALAEIRDGEESISLDIERAILINPQARRGLRLPANGDQTLQRAPSEKVAPLRKCA